MKRFSTWLMSSNPKYSALSNQLYSKLDDASSEYFSKEIHKLRANQRKSNTELIMTIGNLLQEALVQYFSEVVQLTYCRLDSEAAKRALSVEWDKLLHSIGPAKVTSLDAYIKAIDNFSKMFSLKKGIVHLWEEYPYQSALHENGFIPEIGCGFSDSWDKKVNAPWLGDPGTLVLENLSQKEFELGSPGTAWIGILAIAKRCGIPNSMVYLVPALHMEKHLSLPHQAEGVSVPVEQWAASGHNEAAVRLVIEGRLKTDKWQKTINNPEGKLKDPKDVVWCGCLMGFAMVKAYNAIGHQWAFTSGTLNPGGTDDWQPSPEQKGLLVGKGKGDSFCIPTEWARAIWKATKDLYGNISMLPGKVTLPGKVEEVKAIPKAPSLPAPAPKPLTTTSKIKLKVKNP